MWTGGQFSSANSTKLFLIHWQSNSHDNIRIRSLTSILSPTTFINVLDIIRRVTQQSHTRIHWPVTPTRPRVFDFTLKFQSAVWCCNSGGAFNNSNNTVPSWNFQLNLYIISNKSIQCLTCINMSNMKHLTSSMMFSTKFSLQYSITSNYEFIWWNVFGRMKIRYFKLVWIFFKKITFFHVNSKVIQYDFFNLINWLQSSLKTQLIAHFSTHTHTKKTGLNAKYFECILETTRLMHWK